MSLTIQKVFLIHFKNENFKFSSINVRKYINTFPIHLNNENRKFSSLNLRNPIKVPIDLNINLFIFYTLVDKTFLKR